MKLASIRFCNASMSVAVAVLLAVATLISAQSAVAGSARLMVQDTVVPGDIRVVPAVASVGVPRQIVVNMTWPNACAPQTADLIAEPAVDPLVLTVRLNAIATFAACAQVQTPVQLSVSYTPPRAGSIPVVAMISDGRLIAQTNMVTSASAETQKLIGLWIGGPNDQSFLSLNQLSQTDSSLVGVWSLYGRDGAPRWQFIRGGGQVSTDMWHSTLVELSSPTVATCPSSACPAAGGVDQTYIGSVRIRLVTDTQLEIEVLTLVGHPTLPPGTVLLKSTMTRAPL